MTTRKKDGGADHTIICCRCFARCEVRPIKDGDHVRWVVYDEHGEHGCYSAKPGSVTVEPAGGC